MSGIGLEGPIGVGDTLLAGQSKLIPWHFGFPDGATEVWSPQSSNWSPGSPPVGGFPTVVSSSNHARGAAIIAGYCTSNHFGGGIGTWSMQVIIGGEHFVELYDERPVAYNGVPGSGPTGLNNNDLVTLPDPTIPHWRWLQTDPFSMSVLITNSSDQDLQYATLHNGPHMGMFFSFADEDSYPFWPPVITLTTQASQDGSFVGDEAVLSVSNGSSPTGTITFQLYSPSSLIIYTEQVTVTGNGTYSPVPQRVSVEGLYTWVATYSGGNWNPLVASSLDDLDEQINFSRPVPGVAKYTDGSQVWFSATR